MTKVGLHWVAATFHCIDIEIEQGVVLERMGTGKG